MRASLTGGYAPRGVAYTAHPMGNGGFNNPLEPASACADPALLRAFATDASGASGQVPAQLLYPRSREDVQAIVREAIRTRTALVPVRSGPPHV